MMNPISTILGFTGTGRGILIVALVAGLAMIGVGYKSYKLGEDHVVAKNAAQKELIHQAVVEAGGQLGFDFQKIMTEYLDRVTVSKTIHEQVIVKVPTYITKEADAKCVVTKGFVEIHNAAAEDRATKPVDGTVDTPANIAISQIAIDVANNYAIANANAAQLEALQAQVRAYKAKIEELQQTKKKSWVGKLFSKEGGK